MAYNKPWLGFEEQLAKLQQRGLIVTDKAAALNYIERIGYYRLSGYWYSFRERSGKVCELIYKRKKDQKAKVTTLTLETFKAGSCFTDAVDLYVFDKRLRMLAMDALERIEVALRVDISYTLGEKDPFAYLKPECLFPDFSQVLDGREGVTKHHKWLSSHAKLINRSKEEFVKHNKAKYGLPLPIWVACEVWDFGTMSRLFDGMLEADQDTIAKRYGIRNGRIFASWLRSLNYLRNVCAHHSRLWNRNMIEQPKLPSKTDHPWVNDYISNAHAQARCYLLLRICLVLMKRINPNSSWPERVKAHLESFPNLEHLTLNLVGMGAPENWRSDWQ